MQLVYDPWMHSWTGKSERTLQCLFFARVIFKVHHLFFRRDPLFWLSKTRLKKFFATWKNVLNKGGLKNHIFSARNKKRILHCDWNTHSKNLPY